MFESQVTSIPTQDVDDDILIIRCVLIGSVKALRRPNRHLRVSLRSARELLRSSWLELQRRYSDPTDAVARTLIADSTFFPSAKCSLGLDIEPVFERLVAATEDVKGLDAEGEATPELLYSTELQIYCDGRQLAMLDSFQVGLVPSGSQEGDRVYVMEGPSVPLVFRGVGGPLNSGVVLVGDAYIHGIMYGELFAAGIQHPAELLSIR